MCDCARTTVGTNCVTLARDRLWDVHIDWGSNGGYDSDYCNIDTADASIDAAAYYYDSDSEEGIEFFDAGIYYSI
jgi:hypothetical protein